MAQDKETLVRVSVRLPAGQVELMDFLEKNHIFGSTRSAIMRALLHNAIKEMTETNYVQKHHEMMKALGKKS